MCNACKSIPTPTDARVEEVASRLLSTVNEAGLALMISLGHRAGLFDALASSPGVRSDQLAASAGLSERYVREWLGGMVTADVVLYDPQDQTYTLDPAYAAVLPTTAEANMSAMFQFIPVLAGVETELLGAFRRGGGVPYESFERFHEVMAEESDNTVVSCLVDQILPLAPGLIERLESGIDVLDAGCGSGHALCALAEAFPNSRFTGFDLCPEAVDAANATAKARGLTNIRLEARDLSAMNCSARFDLVTAFDIVHDQRDPAGVLRNIHAALRPGATFLMQDIRASSRLENNLEHPLGPFLYTISTMHCMTVSLAHGGAGLGTVWGEELAVEMLGDAGFRGIAVKQLPHDIMNNWYVSTRA